ncbi:MAG: SDR family oxidoreductase [Planctomycetales bacterium]|nr:SDR family oxidoreductase [Planctomycetales bacterium]
METRLAVVTGASSGIGRAIAQQLSAGGVHLVLTGRNAQELAETAASCPSPVERVVGDLNDSAHRAQLRTVVDARPLHYLVHVAGIQEFARLDSIAAVDWERTFAINVHARLYLTQTLLPHFATNARVLFVSSRSAARVRAGAASYCCSYAATEMLVSCLRSELRRELRSDSILVNSFLPGSVDTPLLRRSIAVSRELFPDGTFYQQELERGELREPTEVGKFVRWLLLEAPSAIYDEGPIAIDDPRYAGNRA